MKKIIVRWRSLPPLFILLFLSAAPRVEAQIAINEIMYAPVAPEPEWIEIYNISPAAITLDGWRLEDASGTSCRIGSYMLESGGFVILTEDSLVLRSWRTVGTSIIQVDLPSLNNDADRLLLRDADGTTIDSIRYAASWNTVPRSSLERRAALSNGASASSWGSSRDSSGATPGRRNSLSPPRLNISIDSARYERTGRVVTLWLRNGGTATSAAGTMHLYRDRDGDGIGSVDEEIARAEITALAPGKRMTGTLALPEEPPERVGDGIVEIRVDGDEIAADNLAVLDLPAGSSGAGVIINEIMFDPVRTDEESSAEYIELHNTTAEAIEVAGWKIHDRTERAQGTIPLTRAPIPPGGYLLIASDSSIYQRFPFLHDSSNVVTIGRASFSLNLEEDDVRIRDGSGRTVDSVAYRSDWHWAALAGTRGVSLERISSSASSTDGRNWSSSVAAFGGTPGARNSRSLGIRTVDAALAVTPDILSPDGDGHQDFTRISWRIPHAAAIIALSLYDRHGRLIARLLDNEPAPTEGETIWDGLDGRGNPVPPGIYLLLLEAEGIVARAKVIVGG